MPKPPTVHTGTTPHRKTTWKWVLALIILLVVAAYFLLERKPASQPGDSADNNSAMEAPFTPRHIYSETTNPETDIATALMQAKQERKRVLLDFGGDWCGDCQVLDFYLHQPPNAQLLATHFVLVHIWIGQMDRNIDLAAKYGIPITRGVPALAVLDASGEPLYAQSSGQFADMSHMDPSAVTEFLQRWKN